MISTAKLARVQIGLRQIDLALKTGISPAQISWFENGLRQPCLEKAKKLNGALGRKVYPEGPEICGRGHE